MKNIFFVLALLFLTATQIFAVTATIQNANGQPVEEATIRFAIMDTFILSNSSGEFSLYEQTSVVNMSKSQSLTTFYIDNSNLHINLPQLSSIELNIYNLKGRIIWEQQQVLSKGASIITLPELTPNMYLIELNLGTTRHVHKLIANKITAKEKRPSFSLKKSYNFRNMVDTIFIDHKDYETYVAEIPSYTANLGIIVLKEKASEGQMQLIPAKDSSFLMGSQFGSNLQKPEHRVTFTYDFFMDSTEVTQKGYDTTMSKHYSSYRKPNWASYAGVGDEYPAYYITWFDAVLYCNAKSAIDGKDSVYTYDSIVGIPGNYTKDLIGLTIEPEKNGYRLPTEAEWEYAYRGDFNAATTWWSISNESEIKEFSWFSKNAWSSRWYEPHAEQSGTQPVATRKPNSFSLYDMGGNVWEWCNNWFETYTEDEKIDPSGPSEGIDRVCRGGSWMYGVEYLSPSNRNRHSPSVKNDGIGFRTVRIR